MQKRNRLYRFILKDFFVKNGWFFSLSALFLLGIGITLNFFLMPAQRIQTWFLLQPKQENNTHPVETKPWIIFANSALFLDRFTPTTTSLGFVKDSVVFFTDEHPLIVRVETISQTIFEGRQLLKNRLLNLQQILPFYFTQANDFEWIPLGEQQEKKLYLWYFFPISFCFFFLFWALIYLRYDYDKNHLFLSYQAPYVCKIHPDQSLDPPIFLLLCAHKNILCHYGEYDFHFWRFLEHFSKKQRHLGKKIIWVDLGKQVLLSKFPPAHFHFTLGDFFLLKGLSTEQLIYQGPYFDFIFSENEWTQDYFFHQRWFVLKHFLYENYDFVFFISPQNKVFTLENLLSWVDLNSFKDKITPALESWTQQKADPKNAVFARFF